MNTLTAIRTTTRKELRSYFLSPVALIFLGVFLVATLFIFFTYSKFFVRNLADVRPLFSWLPILLIFLVSALTMRQWSEEQKMGTLEILLTLPLKTRDLVLGKFFAGLALVAIALALTLPLPITVSMLGELDWGPVIGGYLAALLLASTYLAIGLCVSARTDNQIVALLVTALIGSALYLIGSPSIAGVLGYDAAELLRLLGSGSRFESIERGVLDVRDLFYYASLTTFFLLLNVHFLELKRLEGQPAEGRGKLRQLRLIVLLAGLNVVAGNLWLAPVHAVRADLTADGEYSISAVTEEILRDLDEPLTLTGYFSQKTHPLLAPLIPRLRDFMQEYEIRGAGNVRLSFVDPSTDPEVEEEISDQYNIRSVPFRVSDRHEESVVNSYFHILVRYGDAYEVLSFNDLIELHADDNEVHVKLRNPEYDLTRAIKKATQGFQSLDAVLARGEPAKVIAYLSEGLPQEFAEVPARVERAVEALAQRTGGRVVLEKHDPSQDLALAQRLMREEGIQPLAADLFGERTFYMHFVIQVGDKKEVVFPQGQLEEAELRVAFEASLKRLSPGFLKKIGLLTAEKSAPQANPFQPAPPAQADYRALEQAFSQDYQVERVQLDDGTVRGDIDVLLVAKPGDLNEKQRFAIDQYLMRGGSVIVLAGAYQVEPGQFGVSATATDATWLAQLESYGVRIESAFVMDRKNTAFPFPVREQRGAFAFERIELKPYPFFIDVRPEGFQQGHVALAGLPSLALTWASPLTLKAPEGVVAEALVHSSEQSWLQKSTNLQPDYQAHPETGFGREEGAGMAPQVLGATLTGRFKSFFADKPSPLFGSEVKPEASLEERIDRTGRTLKQASADARLVVIGSSEFVSDLITQLAQQLGGGPYRANPLLVHNLIDWALEDTDLLQIRSAGAFARTLRSLESHERSRYELMNYVIVLLALLAVLGIALTRRRLAKPMTLSPQEVEE